MAIWLVCIEDVNKMPPTRSLLAAFSEIFNKVNVVSISPLRYPVSGHIAQYPMSQGLRTSRIGKYFGFRKHVEHCLKRYAEQDDLIWIASLNSGLSLISSRCLLERPFIFQPLELYDEFKIRRRAMISLARKASVVVVPEVNRAAILQVWANLPQRPFVLPNKPYPDRVVDAKPSSACSKSIKTPSSTILLYQGGMGGQRSLTDLIRYVENTPNEVELWLLGQGSYNKRQLSRKNDKVKFLGYFEPPSHLEVTRQAHIGILKYDAVSLNNLYCAPNKVWEYSRFSLPMIANDCPPLRNIFEEYGCGEISDFSRESLEDAVRKIQSEYSKYSDGAQRFYNSVDYLELVRQIVDTTGLLR